MPSTLEHISSQLLKTPLEQLPVNNLQQLASDFPWFATAHLLLAKRNGGNALRRVAICINDVQRLQWLLTEKPVDTASILARFGEAQPEVTAEPAPAADTTATPLVDAALQEAVQPEEVLPELPPEPELVHETLEIPADADDIEAASEPVLITPETGGIADEFPEHAAAIEPEPVLEDLAETEPAGQNDETTDSTSTNAAMVELAEQIAAPEPLPVSEPEQVPEPVLKNIPNTASPFKLNLSGSADMPDLSFQPYHTIDYFASQGIKPEMEAKDKFSSQLRSFTQWLKTMKQVDYKAESHKNPDPVVDAQARASLQDKEIVTEAMAEVLEKQGKKDKAIEIWEKLLLLHPEKSHFFAARIQDLKN